MVISKKTKNDFLMSEQKNEHIVLSTQNLSIGYSSKKEESIIENRQLRLRASPLQIDRRSRAYNRSEAKLANLCPRRMAR